MSNTDYRTICLREKGTSCELCGESGNVVAHHINGDRGDNRLKNLMPVCRGCHTSIHGGGVEGLSDKLPPESRTDKHEGRTGMRPNIRTTHHRHGRVKDYAAENDMSTQDAYQYLIEKALEAEAGEE